MRVQHGDPEHADAQHAGPEHGGPEHGDPDHGHTKVCRIPRALTIVMFYATRWFEMLCGKRRLNECCAESDLACGCSTVVPSTPTPTTPVPSTVVPSTATPTTATPRYVVSLDHRDVLCDSMV